MSRSRRKTSIFAHTTSTSEKKDKKQWHKRWRACERAVLGCLSPDELERHLSMDEHHCSNVWLMAKDGRSYWPHSQQIVEAERVARDKGRNHQERISIKQRLLRKWNGK